MTTLPRRGVLKGLPLAAGAVLTASAASAHAMPPVHAHAVPRREEDPGFPQPETRSTPPWATP
ncbi:hypothetical protein L1856_09960 [Streptomyces sp. Tue 6430]|nr:hypothetical protein [Streptomyces sp. Tue 6430]